MNNNLKDNFYVSVFSAPNKISPILVTCFLGNEWWNGGTKKLLVSPSKNSDE